MAEEEFEPLVSVNHWKHGTENGAEGGLERLIPFSRLTEEN